MGNILVFSTQPAEISKKQSGFFVILVEKMTVQLEKLIPIKNIDFSNLDHLVRKTAHVFNYFMLMMLLLFAWTKTINHVPKITIYSWLIATLFSAFDEFLQTFIPGRAGMLRDVCIDHVGIILGLFLVLWIARRKVAMQIL